MNKGSIVVFGFLCIYIALIVGMTIEAIGDVPECGPYTWKLPISMFVLLVTPAILGFFVGLDLD